MVSEAVGVIAGGVCFLFSTSAWRAERVEMLGETIVT
jgi:hypothetical protein